MKSDSFLHDRIRLAQMRFIKSGVNGADMPDKSAEVLDGINFNVKVDGMGLFVKMVFHLWEQSEAGENYDGGDYRAGIKSEDVYKRQDLHGLRYYSGSNREILCR